MRAGQFAPRLFEQAQQRQLHLLRQRTEDTEQGVINVTRVGRTKVGP